MEIDQDRMTEATPRLDQRLGECGVIGPVEGFEPPVQRRPVDRAIPQRAAIEKPRRHNAEPCPFLAAWRGKLRPPPHSQHAEIGKDSGRGRGGRSGESTGGAVSLKKKKK